MIPRKAQDAQSATTVIEPTIRLIDTAPVVVSLYEHLRDDLRWDMPAHVKGHTLPVFPDCAPDPIPLEPL